MVDDEVQLLNDPDAVTRLLETFPSKGVFQSFPFLDSAAWRLVIIPMAEDVIPKDMVDAEKAVSLQEAADHDAGLIDSLKRKMGVGTFFHPLNDTIQKARRRRIRIEADDPPLLPSPLDFGFALFPV